MQRRRSRDPNVADRLVVELDDDEHTHSLHPRPTSTSPDPPAYSTLPPPYSPTSDHKKHATFTLVVEADDPPSPSPPPSASSAKRSRISTSELRVLVYLYRTVVYGLEMRNRKEKVSDLPNPPTKKKPLGPRCLIPPPEEKSHFERALAAASAAKSKGGFAQFPLVEDDLDSSTPTRTPYPSPSHSPRSSSPLRPSPSLDAVASHFAAAAKKEKPKTDVNAELHVQDALLALRLKEFLRAQGVCEDDLKVDFDDEGKVVDPKEVPVVVEKVHDESDEEINILDEYFMGIEEEESPATKNIRGPIVEDDDDQVVAPSPPPTPTLQVSTMAQRISSPPPPSPSPRPHAVLPTSYMVALLTMRVRHPSKKPANNNDGEKGKDAKSKVKRKSGLSVLVEVD